MTPWLHGLPSQLKQKYLAKWLEPTAFISSCFQQATLDCESKFPQLLLRAVNTIYPEATRYRCSRTQHRPETAARHVMLVAASVSSCSLRVHASFAGSCSLELWIDVGHPLAFLTFAVLVFKMSPPRCGVSFESTVALRCSEVAVPPPNLIRLPRCQTEGFFFIYSDPCKLEARSLKFT